MNNAPIAAESAVPSSGHGLGQFQLKHLLGMMAAVSVLFALLAIQVQDLTPRSKISAVGQTVVLVLLVLGSLLWVLNARRRVERLAGRPLIRVKRLSTRLLHWSVVAGLVVTYLAMSEVSIYKARPDQVVNLLPNPFYLFFAVNYFVIRIWWRIDPASPEACENGLIHGGAKFVPWSSINRHTWSGPKRLQLNLFLKNQFVMHLHTDPQFAEQLEQLLAQRSGTNVPVVAAPA